MKYLLLENLLNHFSEHDLNQWFMPLEMQYDEKTSKFLVFFPHAFFESWFKTQGKEIFEREINNIFLEKFGLQPIIEYSVSTIAQKKHQNLYASFLNKNKKVEINNSFENFYYNKKNEFVLAASYQVASNNSLPKYNPFFIYGKSSTGKTHILNAIYSKLLFLNKNIFMSSGKDFCKNLTFFGVHNFANKFSIFIIDDLQFIDKDLDIQHKFEEFIEFCIAEHKQLIFSASSSFTSNKIYTECLRSRLGMGIILKIANADIDVRMRYALSFCNDNNIKISKNQLLLIAQHCRNISLLKGTMLKIQAFIELSKKDLTDLNVKHILISLGDKNKTISAQDIINFTSKHFDLDKKLILEDARQPHIVKARQIAMYLCRDLLGLSYPSIGKNFGGKDHSTVMYSINKIKIMINRNKDTQIAVTNIKQKCLSI